MGTPPTQSFIQREFLGWDQPALPEAARRLTARYRKGNALDLSGVIVVLPGQRAGRRLQELLAFIAEDENLRLTPPTVATEGRLPEMLYTPKLPFASDVVQDLAWAQALRELPEATRQHVVPHPPDAANAIGWLHLAKVLRGLHRELAADGLDFAAVQRQGPKLKSFNEAQRWHALAEVQRRYLELLDRELLWDIQTARLKAIEFREIATARDIILLGTVDLNNTLRQMLDQIASHVTAYIVAPHELADLFDVHGCLVPSGWDKASIPLRDEQIVQADGPTGQADAVTEWLVALTGRFRKDEIAIGVPDEALVPQLQRQLKQSKVEARWVEGAHIGQSAPFRLLAAAVAFAGGNRYDDFAALARHPDVEEWLHCSLPAQLDQYYNTHLPGKMSARQTLRNPADWPDLSTALKRVEAWLSETSASQPLRNWGGVFRRLLDSVYGERTLQLDEPVDEVLFRTMSRIIEECDKLAAVPAALDTTPLSAADAFRIALGPLADEVLPPPANADALEILGWLELPLDDSRAVIVTTFNEGFVPQAAGADAFLPDRLRRELGLLHNERRYARDAYATSVLCHGREELRVVFGRRDIQDYPLQPSRLLFACPDDVLIRRARRFFAGPKTSSAPRRLLLAGEAPIPERSLFTIPRPPEPGPYGRDLDHISVTEFSQYLACPYRYYLRRIRKLEAVDDAVRELEPFAFGNVLHKTLSAFGRDPEARQSSNERDIFDFLAERLAALAEQSFGSERRRPALRLQIEQARRRLRAFAAYQAKLAQEGWRIVYAEDEEADKLSVTFIVDDSPLALVGRIDRIDCHDSPKRVRVLDYKTADTAVSPEKTHRERQTWVDLQLPLYRHLWPCAATEVSVDCTVELAYFNLPKTVDAVGIALAKWDAALLEEADEVARRVVRNLRDEVHWPPVKPAPKYGEDFAAICLDNTLSAPALADDRQGGAE